MESAPKVPSPLPRRISRSVTSLLLPGVDGSMRAKSRSSLPSPSRSRMVQSPGPVSEPPASVEITLTAVVVFRTLTPLKVALPGKGKDFYREQRRLARSGRAKLRMAWELLREPAGAGPTLALAAEPIRLVPGTHQVIKVPGVTKIAGRCLVFMGLSHAFARAEARCGKDF